MQARGDAARSLDELDRECHAERLVEAVVDRRGGSIGRDRVVHRHHLEAVAVVEVSTHDRANRIEPRTREHDETRPHPRLVLDADPDAILDLRRILRGRLGDSEREEGSGSDQERETMCESCHLVVGLK